jgi:membrane-bound serine protease (ClpP class)
MRLLSRLVPAALIAFLFAPPTPAQDAPAVDGLIVTVPLKITDAGVQQHVKGPIDAARNDRTRNIKKVVLDFTPEGKDAVTEEFGPCYGLTRYLKTLSANGIETIAFVHGKIGGHTVLPAIACDHLGMSAGAVITPVSPPAQALTLKVELQAYLDTAGVKGAGPVLRLIDKNVKLVKADYKGTKIYADLGRLERKDPLYAEVHAGNLTPAQIPANGFFDVGWARELNIADFQAEERADVRERFKLSPASEIGDPLRGKAMKPVRILLEGTIDISLKEKVRRQVETAKAREENTFFFVIETTAGGDPGAARELAFDLIGLGKNADYPARTIAFVPGEAPELAMFLALACQEIYMYKGAGAQGEAVLGDFSALVGAPNQPRRPGPIPEFVRRNLLEVAEQAGFPKLVVDGLFDRDLAIVRARNQADGERRLMTDEELKALADKGWVQESQVKHKGRLLRLTASLAEDLRLAKTVDSKDVGAVYDKFGLDAKDVRAAEPSWLDNFAAFLRRTEVSILLVIIGIAGLVLEMKAPGLIIPGVIAAVCFILFFWAQTQLGGQLIYLAIMLFLLGLALIGIEIFLIPGFGVTGVCGILLVLTGLVLAGLDKAPESTGDWADLIRKLLTYGLTMAGAGVLAFVVSRYLPKIPYANRLMLVPPEDRPEGEELPPLPGVDVAVALLGQVGTATSMLRPAGTAKFGDRYIDVVTEGDFIPPGTAVQVVEVEGTRIVVKRI